MRSLFNAIHSLFVPKEHNNFKAQALHTNALTAYLILALTLTLGVKILGGNVSNILGIATDITTPKLLELTNEERAKQELSPLTYNNKLAEAAAAKAKDMFQKNYWAHYGPAGETPWEFIVHSGYDYEYAGENLAKNFLFSQGVVEAWMNSKTHRENLLRTEYSEVGFAIVNGVLNGEETTLVVQMFGKPRSGVIAHDQIQSGSTTTQVTAKNTTTQTPAVLADTNSKKTFSIAQFNFNINFIFMLFILIALVFDLYFATKMNIIRIGGKNVAHIIFIGFMLLGLVLLTKGAIL